MKPVNYIILSVLLMLFIAFQGCTQQPPDARDEPVQEGLLINEDIVDVDKAICVLYPTNGNEVTGTVRFEHTDEGVRVTADVKGLSPGKHGFHVHEYGDCSAPGATTAGGHFDPENQPHGGPKDMQRHVGDLGNIEANENGIATMEMVDSKLTLVGENSIIGRAVVVHKGEDDLESQPTGKAGPRVACGVIGVDGEK